MRTDFRKAEDTQGSVGPGFGLSSFFQNGNGNGIWPYMVATRNSKLEKIVTSLFILEQKEHPGGNRWLRHKPLRRRPDTARSRHLRSGSCGRSPSRPKAGAFLGLSLIRRQPRRRTGCSSGHPPSPRRSQPRAAGRRWIWLRWGHRRG